MAAQHQETYFLPQTIHQFRLALIDPAFASALDLTFKGETILATGVSYKFNHGMSFVSWGEDITVTLTAAPNGTQVMIHSQCDMPLQVIDYGKNYAMVQNVYEYLTANVYRYPDENGQYAVTGGVYAAPGAIPAANPAAAPRFCRYCGAALSPGARFCSTCGKEI